MLIFSLEYYPHPHPQAASSGIIKPEKAVMTQLRCFKDLNMPMQVCVGYIRNQLKGILPTTRREAFEKHMSQFCAPPSVTSSEMVDSQLRAMLLIFQILMSKSANSRLAFMRLMSMKKFLMILFL